MMMDVRLYILAGTFALLVVSLLYLVVVVIRASRGAYAPQPGETPMYGMALPPATPKRADTNLAGLDVELRPDSVQAAMAAPLRVGDWHPPDVRSPLDVAPIPYVEIPPVPPAVPEPAPEREPVSAPEPVAMSGPVLAPEPVAVLEPVAVPVTVPEPVVWSMPAPPLASELESRIPPVEAPSAMPLEHRIPEVGPPEPPTASTAEPAAPLLLSAAEFASAPEPESAPESPPAPEPVLVPAPAQAAAAVLNPEDLDAVLWESMLRTQQTAIEQASVSLPASAPIAGFADAMVPTPPASEPLGYTGVSIEPTLDAPPAPVPPAALEADPRSDVQEHVLVAPVEMWFGDARVGVKPGTRTYDQFLRYADVLLADLKVAKRAM
ncbi:MAG: hypothetical protein Q8K89_12950 [Actinomycetota bacterium]|nr:hypothetical protein [Actinomycetota bacterium]